MVVARPAPSDREEFAGPLVALCFTPRRPSMPGAYGVRATLVLKLIATSVPEKEKHDGRKLLVQFCRRQNPVGREHKNGALCLDSCPASA